jgi:hypothetical protein
MKNSKVEFKNKKLWFLAYIIFGILGLVLSLIISEYHIVGDQLHYLNAYTLIEGLNIYDAFQLYQSIIFTGEFIHFFIVWIFSNMHIEKDIVMSVSNVILLLAFLKILQLNKYPLWLASLIVFNPYILALFFTLERNKFAFIFLFFYLIYSVRFLLILSILTHSSGLLLIIPKFFYSISSKIQLKILIKKIDLIRILKFIFFASFVISVLYLLLYSHIYDKFFLYNQSTRVEYEVAPYFLSLIFFITLYSSNDKYIVLTVFIFLIAIYYILGGDRVNMFGYFAFLYFSNPKNLFFQFFCTLLSIFLLHRSYIYIDNIIFYGG